MYLTTFLAEQQNQDAYWHITEEMVQNGQLTHNNWKGEFFRANDAKNL